MKKKKKKVKVKAKKPKKKADPNIEEIYWDEITFFCPVKQKMVSQKIRVKRYKPLSGIVNTEAVTVSTPDPLADIEKDDEGINIYGATEEIDE